MVEFSGSPPCLRPPGRGRVALIPPKRSAMARFLPVHAALAACLVLFLLCPPALYAADPVEVEVTGVEGAPLENVQKALALPYGMVRDGKVDRLWLDRFSNQAGEKGRLALEPFGYYHAEVSATVQERKQGEYRLLVSVIPGKPVRVTEVEVQLKGAGAGEGQLRQLAASFPLRKGDVLLQPEYERAKSDLKARAVTLG